MFAVKTCTQPPLAPQFPTHRVNLATQRRDLGDTRWHPGSACEHSRKLRNGSRRCWRRRWRGCCRRVARVCRVGLAAEIGVRVHHGKGSVGVCGECIPTSRIEGGALIQARRRSGEGRTARRALFSTCSTKRSRRMCIEAGSDIFTACNSMGGKGGGTRILPPVFSRC
jgi:hypothetical protein